MKNILFFVLLAFSCAPKSSDKENTLAQIDNSEVMQYAVIGKTIYENHCGNCHQEDGRGLGKLIPPLRDSDYLKASVHRAVWIMKHGQEGKIIVNDQEYNQAMPANPTLTPLEISQISTYLYNIWGLKEGVISPNQVQEYLNEEPEF